MYKIDPGKKWQAKAILEEVETFDLVLEAKGYSSIYEDLEFFKKKLYAALAIPKEYLLDSYSLVKDPVDEHCKIKVECECGAEKCGTTHSNWCPKYK